MGAYEKIKNKRTMGEISIFQNNLREVLVVVVVVIIVTVGFSFPLNI